ncbi:PucR family transcriptional regulator [Thermosediminibacter oceani]|uniref:Transcriptional regulator, CdaR n=1 Tax=Thermosediminibacter oceani (strain ATCC BAA-1034 / DSM 16646 / JW/IW-1228P) TaxID=555079 RepID=D9RYW4_THEOJ|nr:helix-turn-helix domain-containing protein [Thermosediminibacter oceani]ADL08538.1 transcriptional regulator, CdaR [Thermosediminibacter oceani DSM 16646]
MQKAIAEILLELKKRLKTPFAILDKKGRCVLQEKLVEKPARCTVKLCGSEYVLVAELAREQLVDFSLLLEELVNRRFSEKLMAFLDGKGDIIEDLPCPCGLILIKSSGSFEPEPFIESLFDEALLAKTGEAFIFIIPAADLDELKETSRALYQTLAEEVSSKTLICIGGIARVPQELPALYRDAVKALKFAPFIKTGVLYYPEMALERLLASLPDESRREFMMEMRRKIQFLDEEAIKTIRTVIDCNLNLAMAARKLYIHRNTLMYRLDKISSQTGLDIRKFKDAVKMEIFLALNEFQQ